MRLACSIPLVFLALNGAVAASGYDPAITGTWSVASTDGVWRDDARSRDLPYRLHRPVGATSPCPLIVFSHGLGGTREGYAYLGSWWASHGYLALHLQHHGSDDAVWRGERQPLRNMRAATADYRVALDRVRDVTFALDCMEAGATSGWAAQVDREAIGLAGHSFGSWTVLAAAGQRLGPLGDRLAEPRIRAGLAMSSPVPRGVRKDTYDTIRIPILHMTGTEDASPIGDTAPVDRRVPFDRIAAGNQYLVIFQGGDHMIFSGRARGTSDPRDEQFQQLIRAGSLAFWDAYLRNDANARQWLCQGGFEKLLGKYGRYEVKTDGKQDRGSSEIPPN